MARIGVFVCHCGTNIASTVDVKYAAEEMSKEKGVIISRDYKYMCSDPGQKIIKEYIRLYKLDRVVVASCSPLLHERTFQNTVQEEGMNPYLMEMANIREQCSWVHKDRAEATLKAIELIKMSVAKARMNEPLFPKGIPVERKALVIGGGISGMQAALDIAMVGHPVLLVERSPSIGGRMAQFDKTFPTLDCAACILTPKMVDVRSNPNIRILSYSEVESVEGYVGNFEVKIRKKARSVDMSKCTGCGECMLKCPSRVESEFDLGLGKRKAIYIPFPQAVPNVPVIDRAHCRYYTQGKCKVCQKVCPAEAINYEQEDEVITEKVGAIVAATGFDLSDPNDYSEYGGGRYKDVINGLQFERMINASGPTEGHLKRPSDGKEPKTIVFIQCVGSRDENLGRPYCSKMCCMYTAKHAILTKEHIPDAQVYVFYIDIRAAGKNYEEFVRRAIEQYGAIYLRGRVSRIFEKNGKLIVRGADTLLRSQVEIEADMVVLATALVARKDAVKVAQMLGIPYDQNQFFTEMHPKLAPVENVTSGIYLTGACQAPKDIPDSVASASGASVKVCALFASDELISDPMTAQVNPALCSLCKTCVDICPFRAIIEEEVQMPDGRVQRQMRVIDGVCHGCGACVASCRPGALSLKGYTDQQIFAEIESLASSF
ncbi:MAG: CoB--CoM heterodisulfide reductase iron-sulfur subunit A family protein [Thermodesulfobacteriota bacterium]|nr:CoB--CoM heterodisulfide reductase iron-sulfur subunit A family protein [Thermodesulfobacteriota bacterium]